MNSFTFSSKDLLTSPEQEERIVSSSMATGKIIHYSNNIFQAVTLHLQYALEELQEDSPAYLDIKAALNIIEEASTLYKKTQQSMTNISLLPHHFDFKENVEHWVNNIREMITDSITLNMNSVDEKLLINTDERILSEVLTSFVNNAVEQMHYGGTLSIDITTTEQPAKKTNKNLPLDSAGNSVKCLSISIHDTGFGIEEEQRKVLFQPFNTKKNFQKGHGLSLTKAFFFAKKSGGTLNVYSNAKKGTRIELLIPLASSDSKRTETTPPAEIELHLASTDQPLAGKKVLLAEDNPIVMDVCRRIMENEGLIVTTAENGEEAIERFFDESCNFDLVILDIIMPRAMGTEVAESILQHTPSMPVLFTSGYYKSIEETRVFHPAIKGILQKPFSHEQFVNTICKALIK
ncbi:MAG: response regulator [Sumerlaeia bacterium]